MSMLARIPVMCNDEVHHISIWQPGDEKSCGPEHVVTLEDGNVLCYEEHDVELDLTVFDLTGVKPDCFSWMDTLENNLLTVILSKDFEATKFCVLAGADVNVYFSSPLCYAAMKNQYRIANFLVEHGAAVSHKMGPEREPITHAAKYGNGKIAKLFIKHGADPNVGNYTPLHEAAKEGHLGMVKLLLKYNPTYLAVQESHLLALRYAKNLKVFHYLKDYLQKMEWKKP